MPDDPCCMSNALDQRCSCGASAKRPMSEAPKDGAPILAQIAHGLDRIYGPYDEKYARMVGGNFVVVRHPGIAADGFDIGWSLAGPYGQGFGGDEYFSGWWPLPSSKGAGDGD